MRKLKSLLLCGSLLLLSCPHAAAQRHEILDADIQSLQVVADGDWMRLPIIELNGGRISVSFDDLTHEYHRYAYRLEHCEADWRVSDELFESDYCSGFASGNTIDDVQESVLTNTQYTHYSLILPNEDCAMKLSGNYRLTVYDENDENHPILRVCFMVVEPIAERMGVSLQVVTNTDASINQAHQQVEMELNYGNYSVTDPARQLSTVLLQNQRWDDARSNARPQYTMADGLRWSHCKDYLFWAGNEYRKFEILSTDVATMGVDRIGWDGSQYHVYPFEGQPRLNYVYDVDADGAFVIRNSDNRSVDTESDYMLVHFQYRCPEPLSEEVYINGNFTNDRFLSQYLMQYDAEEQRYECVVPLKLGYYNYQLLTLDANGRSSYMPLEGSYYQTQNSYQALVYYKPVGGRTDKLVGYAQVRCNDR